MQAVLADIAPQNAGRTYSAGDLCIFGARPADTLALLRETGHIHSLPGDARCDGALSSFE